MAEGAGLAGFGSYSALKLWHEAARDKSVGIRPALLPSELFPFPREQLAEISNHCSHVSWFA